MTKNYHELEKLIKDGYISRQKHPRLELFIYNYTAAAQYKRVWNEWTLSCRGLIMDAEYNVIARPFGKFFNIEECESTGIKIPQESFKIYEKLDGSLGILYWEDGQPAIATRGSFASDQALFATSYLLPKYSKFIDQLDKNFTYLFEIIYPENRIVLDYGKTERLVLLAIIDTETGVEKSIENLNWPDKAKMYDGISDLNKISKMENGNEEGFVIRFQSGLRVKYKFNEYKRLHRILTGISKRNIWEMLRNNENLDLLMENVPDEFYDWVKQTKLEIENDYQKLLNTALSAIEIDDLATIDRKSAAITINQKYKQFAALIFTLLDKNNPKDQIFKMIRPEAQKPFSKDIDA